MRTESYEFQSYELSDPRFGTSRSLKSTGILPDWPRGRRLGRVGECESPERNFSGTFQNCFAVISPVSQKLKSSMRAYVFRFAPKSGHCKMHSACPFRANKRHRSRMAAQSAGIIN